MTRSIAQKYLDSFSKISKLNGYKVSGVTRGDKQASTSYFIEGYKLVRLHAQLLFYYFESRDYEVTLDTFTSKDEIELQANREHVTYKFVAFKDPDSDVCQLTCSVTINHLWE